MKYTNPQYTRHALLRQGIYTDKNIIFGYNMRDGVYSFIFKRGDVKLKATSQAYHSGITALVGHIKQTMKHGIKIDGFRMGDFRLLGLFKAVSGREIIAGTGLIELSESFDDWKGSHFIAREITAKQFIDFDRGRGEIYENTATEHE